MLVCGWIGGDVIPTAYLVFVCRILIFKANFKYLGKDKVIFLNELELMVS